MKNSIRMFDLERVLTYQSATPGSYMVLPDNQKHSAKIESVLQGIEHSYDWALNKCSQNEYSLSLNTDIWNFDGQKFSDVVMDSLVLDTKAIIIAALGTAGSQ